MEQWCLAKKYTLAVLMCETLSVSVCISMYHTTKNNTGPLNDMIEIKSNKKLARRPSPNDAEADD